MEPFYVTLPSNASTNHYPDNAVSHFRTKLPNSISLPQNWEVGLCELIFPANWYNVVDGRNGVTFRRKAGNVLMSARLSQVAIDRPFSKVNGLLEEMQNLIRTVVDCGNVEVFSLHNRRITIKLPPRVSQITLDHELAYDLGLDSPDIKQTATNMRAHLRSFPNKNYTFMVHIKEEVINLKKDIESKIFLPEGHYDKAEKLLKPLNVLMESMLNLPNLQSREGFLMDGEGKHVEVKLPFEGIEVEMDDPIAALLGFNRHKFAGTDRIKAEFPFDVKSSFYSLFVYSDIIKPQVVGDSHAKLLQVTPAPQRTNTIISHTFNPIQYAALERNSFETIDIAIRNSPGDYVPFTTGLSIVKLHFRPKA